MSIKEFEIKPGDYYEAGYFDSDYIEGQNFSVATLTCDFDRVLGFEFQAGFYFEEGFIEEGAFGVNSIISTLEVEAMVVQVAEISLGGYVNDGYYQQGYYESRGSFFTLTAELERFGEVKDFEATLTADCSVDAVIGKIIDSDAALVSEFTQTAFAGNLIGIDLVAFSDAELVADISRIRDLALIQVPDRTAKTVTRVGDTFLDTSQSVFGGASARFDGRNDRLEIASSSDFAFGTDDWTIEFWSNLVSDSNNRSVLDWRTTSSQATPWIYSDDGEITVRINDNDRLFWSSNLNRNRWYHIAVTRVGGVHTLFVDGVSRSTWLNTNISYVQGGTVKIGEDFNNGSDFNGWLDDLRIVRGSALYTANFTPPQEQLTSIPGTVLLLNNNIETDNTSFFDTISIETIPENFTAISGLSADTNVIRGVSIATDSGFILASTPVIIRDLAIDAAAEFTLAADYDSIRLIEVEASLESQFATNIQARRIRTAARNLTSLFGLSTSVRVLLGDSNYPIENRGLINFDQIPATDAFGASLGGASSYTLIDQGKFNKAASFPTSSPLSLTRTNSLYSNLFGNQGLESWTVDFWFKPRELSFSNLQPYTGIFALSDGNSPFADDPRDYNIMLVWEQSTLLSGNNASGRFRFGRWWTSPRATQNYTYSYNGLGSIANEYKHIAVTFKNLGPVPGNPGLFSAELKVYVDGQLSNMRSDPYIDSPLISSNSLFVMPFLRRVGTRDNPNNPPFSTRFFQGSVDEFRFNEGIVYNSNFTPPTAAYIPKPFFRAGYVDAESKATLTSDFLKIGIVSADLNSSFTKVIDSERFRTFNSNQTAVVTQQTQATIISRANAVLNSEFTATTDSDVVRTAGAVLSSVTAITAAADRRRNTNADLTAAASVSVDIDKFTGITGDFNSQAALSAAFDRTRDLGANFESIVTKTTAIARILKPTASMFADTALTAAVDKVAVASSDQFIEFTADITVRKITDITSLMPSTAELDIDYDVFRITGSDMFSEFTTEIEAQVDISSQSALFSEFNIDIAADRIRGLDVNTQTAVSLDINYDVFRISGSEMFSEFSVLAATNKLVSITADLEVLAFKLAAGEVYNLEPALIILRENRELVIEPESRWLLINPESRVLTVE